MKLKITLLAFLFAVLPQAQTQDLIGLSQGELVAFEPIYKGTKWSNAHSNLWGYYVIYDLGMLDK